MKDELLTNFIPVNRKLFEHHLWCEEREYSRFEAWLYLLKEARFEDTKLLDKGKLVLIKRGQVYASMRFLATAFGWSTKKVGNFLQMLETDKMISRETVKETGQTMLNICNYDKYNMVKSEEETQKETVRKQQGNAEETKSNKDNIVNKDNNIKDEFENFRKRYPGSKRGLDTEFENFCKKNKDFKEVVHLLLPAINNLIEWRQAREQAKEFVPPYANLQTWINQRRWEVELEQVNKTEKNEQQTYVIPE